MKVTVDTNILVRAAVHDEPQQAKLASRLLQEAELIAIPSVVFCEFSWVLRSVYKFSSTQIATTIRALMTTTNVEINEPAVEAGLALLEADGGFADGVIAYEGKWLGAEKFVSFDREAVTLLQKQGLEAELLK